MKISVCGKGGSGKSTIVSLLAERFAAAGKEVLIIDSDESNYGLHRHLSMENPKEFTGFFGGKEEVLKDMMLSNFTHQFFEGQWKLSDIPKGYYTEKNGIKLMVSGKIHQANEGCACAMGTVMKQFVSRLTLEENQIAILDMEAGIEHFGRGLDDEVDLILMVCDPSYESARLAVKIGELSGRLQKPVYYVLNKVDEESRKVLEQAIGDPERILAVLPVEPELTKAALLGQKLVLENSELNQAAKKICRTQI